MPRKNIYTGGWSFSVTFAKDVSLEWSDLDEEEASTYQNLILSPVGNFRVGTAESNHRYVINPERVSYCKVFKTTRWVNVDDEGNVIENE